jgi:hypothetical protein
MTIDHLREAGTLVAHLQRALLDGSRDLALVPGLIRRIIADGMWRERTDPLSGRKYGPFRSFEEFVATPAEDGGLGSTIRQLAGLCRDDVLAKDALDRAVQREVGRPPEILYNVQDYPAPAGNTESAALRRLRKDRSDLHARVLAGAMSAHAAMIDAGFRPRTFSVRADDPRSAARSLHKHMSAGYLAELIRLLQED